MRRLLLVCSLFVGCHRGAPARVDAPPAEPAASAPREATSSAPPPAALPDHWSTLTRNPSTRPALERERGSALLAVTVDGDAGGEGELYVERVASGLIGLWGDTVVVGAIDEAGALSLRDAGTGEVVFVGTWSGGKLDGSVRAEGEQRRVRSLPPRALATISDRLTIDESRRTLAIDLDRGAVVRAETTRFDGGKPTREKANVRVEGGELIVSGAAGDWRLHPTARGFVGRAPSGSVVRASLEHDDGGPLPQRVGDVRLSSTRLRKGARGTPCEIDVELPSVRGTPGDAAIDAALSRAAFDAAAGMWPAGVPPPTRADFTCTRDPLVPLRIQSASFAATPLSAGFVNLRMSGYARFSDVGGVTVSSQCLLLDTRGGKLVPDVLAALPDAARDAVQRHADRSLKRDLRAARLTIDDLYTDESLSTLSGTSACATATGVRLLVPLGIITKQMPTGPLIADVPRRVLAEHLPADHPLRRAWGD